jgi:hypothetical protein
MFPFPGPSSVNFTDFVTEGWRRVNGKAPRTETVLNARELEIRPVLKNNSEVRLVFHWHASSYYYYFFFKHASLVDSVCCYQKQPTFVSSSLTSRGMAQVQPSS